MRRSVSLWYPQTMLLPFVVVAVSAAFTLGVLTASLYAVLLRSAAPPLLLRLLPLSLAAAVLLLFGFGAVTDLLGWTYFVAAAAFAAAFLGAVLFAPDPVPEYAVPKSLAERLPPFANVRKRGFRAIQFGAPWLFILMAAGYAAASWSTPVILTPDSQGYLEFQEARTAGYPIFLEVVVAVFGGTAAVPNVQLALAAAAIAFLGWCVHRAYGAPLIGIALAFSLMSIPDLSETHAQIMTESLFVSLLCVMFGSLMLLTKRPAWRYAALAALACGLAITIRPAAMSLLPIFPIALWLILRRSAGQRLQLVAAVVVPIALCIGAESALWQMRHGAGLPNGLVNRHVFAKALLIEPNPRLNDPELAAVVNYGRSALEPGRGLIDGAPNLQARALLLRNFEVAAQYQTYFREIDILMYAVSDSRGVPKDDLLGQAGWAAMRGAPGAWALNALTHYWGLWTAYWVYRPDFIASYEAYTQNLEESDLFTEARVFQPLPPAGLRIRLIMLAGLAVSLIAIGLAVRQFLLSPRPLDGRLAVASLSGLAVHGHFLLIGLTGVATPRYALVMLPVLALCGFLLVNWVVEQAWSRMEKQHPHPRQCESRRTG